VALPWQQQHLRDQKMMCQTCTHSLSLHQLMLLAVNPASPQVLSMLQQ
jgi:hypothetical protein